MSEAPCITAMPMHDKKLGSCGVLPSNTEAKIIDPESGVPLGPGNVGELCIKGPQVILFSYGSIKLLQRGKIR